MTGYLAFGSSSLCNCAHLLGVLFLVCESAGPLQLRPPYSEDVHYVEQLRTVHF